MPYPRVADQGTPYGPLVTFKTQAIFPPSALYIGPNDQIELDGRAPSVGVVCTMAIRILTPQGEIKETILTAAIQTVGLQVASFFTTPDEGFLISAHISSNSASRGQCFVKAFIHKAAGQQDFILGALLFQGYVSTDDHLSYPNSVPESSLNGRGWTHTVALSNPPAGTPAVFTVPTGVRWLFKSLSFQFTTDATAGNRTVGYSILDPSSVNVCILQSPNQQPASQSVFYSAAPGFPVIVSAAAPWLMMPNDIILTAGSQLRIIPIFVGAGDRIVVPAASVEEWIAQ